MTIISDSLFHDGLYGNRTYGNGRHDSIVRMTIFNMAIVRIIGTHDNVNKAIVRMPKSLTFAKK